MSQVVVSQHSASPMDDIVLFSATPLALFENDAPIENFDDVPAQQEGYSPQHGSAIMIVIHLQQKAFRHLAFKAFKHNKLLAVTGSFRNV